MRDKQPGACAPIPPQNLEAEQSFLGSIMISQKAFEDTEAIIKAGDFYREAHKTIYQAVVRLTMKHMPIDIVTIQEELRSAKQLDLAGGTEYLEALIDSIPSAANAEHYAGIIRKKAQLRRIIDASTLFAQDAYAADANPEKILSRMSSKSLDLLTATEDMEYSHISTFATRAFEQIEERSQNPQEVTGIPSGISTLDRLTTGWQDGNMIIVAARPSNGKTAFLLQTVAAAGKVGKKGGIFSIEMSGEDLTIRLFSVLTGVSSWQMRTGRGLEPEDWELLSHAYGEVYDMPVYIRDVSRQSIKSIEVIARQMVQKMGVDYFLLDYIQLVDANNRDLPSRQQEVAEVSKTVKNIARQTKKPFIVAAQLNRVSEFRPDSEPKVSDLRESGQLEQDADVILLLHNPRPKDEPDSMSPRPAKIIVGKQRNLSTGVVNVMWDGNKQRFIPVEEYR